METGQSTRLGKYRLLGELGHGGMAKVFLALAQGPAGFNKLVVIKQIQSELADDPEFVNMFLDEARLAARLNHPNVVQTNEVGREDDRYFIAMEYLEGQTLRRALQRLARGSDPALTLGMQLRILSEALAGLHYAHELADYDGTPLGVVHRDVSPHNIFLTYSGQVKVVDFGIAKALNSATETRTGVLKGKVAYMSPEQARGEGVDRRADVYSAGIVLWEIAAGQRLFRLLPEVAVLQKLIANDIPPPSSVRPEVDQRLEGICMRALAANPIDRYQTAAELATEIEALLRELGDESSCRDAGKLLAASFASDRERVKRLIEDQIQLLSDKDSDVAQLPLLEVAPASSTNASISGPRTAPNSSLTPRSMSGMSTLVLSGAPGAAPLKRPWRGVTLLSLAVVVLVLGAYLFLRDGAEARSDAPPASTTSGSAEQAQFTLRLDSRPPGAKVRCAGELIGVTPLEVKVKANEKHCAFVLVRNGFEPYAVEAAQLSGDLTILASLVPEAAPPASEPRASAAADPSPPPRPGPGPAPAQPPPVAPPPPPPPPKPDDLRPTR
jgi:serine/threonine-protein kinase